MREAAVPKGMCVRYAKTESDNVEIGEYCCAGKSEEHSAMAMLAGDELAECHPYGRMCDCR